MEKHEYKLKRQLTETQTIELANEIEKYMEERAEQDVDGDYRYFRDDYLEVDLSDGTFVIAQFDWYGHNVVKSYQRATYDYPEYCECEISGELDDVQAESFDEEKNEEVELVFDKKLVRKICEFSYDA